MSEFKAEFWQEIKDKHTEAYKKWCLFYKKYTFKNVCYCDLVDFFDEQGIKIFILPYAYSMFIFNIVEKTNSPIYNSKNHNLYFVLRNEAKFESVKKAFEILNNQLENEE